MIRGNKSCRLAKYILVFIFSICLVPFLQSQQLNLPSEDAIELSKELCFCKPGVTNKSRGKGVFFQYGINKGFFLTPSGIDRENLLSAEVEYQTYIKAKVKIPIVNIPGFKFLAGYEFDAETFHFSSFGNSHSDVFQNLDNRTLKTNKFTLYLSKSFDEKYYAIMRLRASYNGDYGGVVSFANRYAGYSVSALFGVKPNPDTEWGAGLSFSSNFIRTRIWPFLIFNKTFNDKWGLESVIPVQVFGRYNISTYSVLLFGTAFRSKNYSWDVFDTQSNQDFNYHLRHASINPQISYDQRILPWVWLNTKVGYTIPFSTEFNNIDLPEAYFEAKPENNLFFKIGLFLSPPSQFVK